MSDAVALLRDVGDPLVLDGAVTVRESYPSAITQNPLPDRSYATDGKQRRPSKITIEAVVSPQPGHAITTTGDARLDEVRAWLARADRDAEVLDVQRPGRALAVGYLLGTYGIEIGNSNAERLTIELEESRITRTERVDIERRVRERRPAETAEPGLSTEQEGGRRSLLATLFGVGG